MMYVVCWFVGFLISCFLIGVRKKHLNRNWRHEELGTLIIGAVLWPGTSIGLIAYYILIAFKKFVMKIVDCGTTFDFEQFSSSIIRQVNKLFGGAKKQ